jgi:uncharacterized protein (TIGR04255 family)
MNPPFPKEISPSPIVSATVEIRFVSDLKEGEVLDFFYRHFSTILPKAKGNQPPLPLPVFKTLSPQFKYWADYILNNDEYSMSIGRNIVGFGIKRDYTLWSNYYQFVKNCIEKLFSSNRVKKIERIGIRYINVFQNENSIEGFLDSGLRLPYPESGYSLENERFSTNATRDDVNILLQVAEKAQIKKDDNTTVKGVLLDVDAFQNQNLPTTFEENVINIIDKLHQEAKTIFFLSLNSDYVKEKYRLQY